MPCFYPPNYSVTKIVTEPKIDISISSSLINRINLVYQESALLYYRSTSQIFIPHCLLIAKGDTLELVDSPFSHSLVSEYYKNLGDNDKPNQGSDLNAADQNDDDLLDQSNDAIMSPTGGNLGTSNVVKNTNALNEGQQKTTFLQTSIGPGPPQMAEFTFENKWTSGPLKQFSSSPEAF